MMLEREPRGRLQSDGTAQRSNLSRCTWIRLQ